MYSLEAKDKMVIIPEREQGHKRLEKLRSGSGAESIE